MSPRSCFCNPKGFSRLHQQGLHQICCRHPTRFHCILSFEEYEQPLNLQLEVLQSYLEKDLIKMCKGNLKSFKNCNFVKYIHFFKTLHYLRKFSWLTLTSTNTRFEVGARLTETYIFVWNIFYNSNLKILGKGFYISIFTIISNLQVFANS